MMLCHLSKAYGDSLTRNSRLRIGVFPMSCTAMLSKRIVWMLTLILLAAGGPHAAQACAAQSSASNTVGPQWWKCTIEIPGGSAIECMALFKPGNAPSSYEATLDIPSQQVVAMRLVDVEFTDTKITFRQPPPAPAVHVLTRSSDGRTATGEFRQGGRIFKERLERITEEEAKLVGGDRPQAPMPPFPYAQRDAVYTNVDDGAQLAGTLTIPEGKGPHPAVILLTGSGVQDRDETIFDHKPFWVIADHLSRRGIAVLRVDDRGIGGSGGLSNDLTGADLVKDVLAGIAYLKNQPEVDANRIGLIGHSEGGTVAPIVAVESPDVACIILLAGTGVPGGDILLSQNEAALLANGSTPSQVAAVLHAYRAVLAVIDKTDSSHALKPVVRDLIKAQFAAQPGAEGKPVSDEAVQPHLHRATYTFTLPMLRWFIIHDPRQSLQAVECPVLALNGSLDLQVLPELNLRAIETALKSGGNPSYTVKELHSLNHLFQEAKLGTVAEYAAIRQTISPLALEEMTTWLQTRFGL